jgi:PncC family amidohydrolase
MLMEFERSSVFVEAKIPYVIAKGFERISDGVYFDTVYEKPFVFIPNELQKTDSFDYLSKIFKGDILKIGIFDKQIKDKRIVYSDEVETIMTAEFRELEAIKKIVGEDRIYTTSGQTPQEALFDVLREKNVTVSFAESCTAGLISAHMADLPGSSNYFMGGCVTYSNEFKSRYLGVNSNTLNSFGAVSREVATQMAVGVLNNSKTDFSVAVTGIAGPTGGSKEKPVGLVYIAVATRSAVDVRKKIFSGNRKIIREKTARYALLLLREFILAQ